MKRHVAAAILLLVSSAPLTAQTSQSCWSGSMENERGAGPRALLSFHDDRAGKPSATFYLLAKEVTQLEPLSFVRKGDSLAFTVRAPSDTAVMAFQGVFNGTQRFSGQWRRAGHTSPFSFVPLTNALVARRLIGRWQGKVAITAARVNQLVLKIVPAPCGYVNATFEALEPSQPDVAFTDLRVSADSLRFGIAYLDLQYTGAINADGTSLRGILTQQGTDYPVTFSKVGGTPKTP